MSTKIERCPSRTVQPRPRCRTVHDRFGSMPAADRRYHLANVTPESRDGWRQFARLYGVNVTALAEVLGPYLATFEPPGRLPKWLAELVEEARDLADDRSRRPQADD